MAKYMTMVPVLTMLASACAAPAPTAPQSSALAIVRLSPAANEVLTAGASVTLRLVVMPDVAGQLSLSVRDQARVALLASDPTLGLQPGQEASIEAAFVVPADARSVVLLADFRPAANGAMPTAVFARYAVAH